MGQLLHGSARTTAARRRAIQNSQESLTRMAQRYDLNAKTIAKWRKRTTAVDDAPVGPHHPHSTVLTIEQEAMMVAFRKQTLSPLDDCLYALQASIPHLTRSSLHRCWQRHGISRLPQIGDKPAKKKFAHYPIGYFDVDIAEVSTKEGRLYLFVAIDRTSKFAYAELHPDQTRDTACQFLLRVIAAVPYHLHTILTDNGIQFTNRQKDKWAFKHLFDRICEQHGIEHRLTKINHPLTNGQVERMNPTLKDATVKRYYDETHEQLKEHLSQFLMAYNFARRLKTLQGLTPYEHISLCWQREPERFKLNPHHHNLGLNT